MSKDYTRGVTSGPMSALEILTKDRDEWKKRALSKERHEHALEVMSAEKNEWQRRALAAEAVAAWEDDTPDEWTEQINEAHPARSNAHDEYGVAMKMVGNRRSKQALVALVTWLLVRRAGAK